jgi:two-component system chemotaxis sensor kinase CheA
MVEVGGHSFALPLTSVSEIFDLELNSVRNVDGQATIVIRDKAIPLFFLQDWLIRDLPADYEHPKCGHVVLVNFGGSQQVAFVVDELIGQEEVVIKPLDNLLHGTPGMAGATVTSNGGIALILDVPSLLKAYAKKYSSTIKKLR